MGHNTICITAENEPEKIRRRPHFFPRRIFGAIIFFGGGGQIRRLGGLNVRVKINTSYSKWAFCQRGAFHKDPS